MTHEYVPAFTPRDSLLLASSHLSIESKFDHSHLGSSPLAVNGGVGSHSGGGGDGNSNNNNRNGAGRKTSPPSSARSAVARSQQVTQSVIQQCVQQNTLSVLGAKPTARAVYSLKKYLSRPDTVDIVYLKVMDRVEDDRSNSDVLLTQAIRLLKDHLLAHPPTLFVLTLLDAFCMEWQCAPNVSIPNRKSLVFCRALIADCVSRSTNTGVSLEHGGARDASTSSWAVSANGASPTPASSAISPERKSSKSKDSKKRSKRSSDNDEKKSKRPPSRGRSRTSDMTKNPWVAGDVSSSTGSSHSDPELSTATKEVASRSPAGPSKLKDVPVSDGPKESEPVTNMLLHRIYSKQYVPKMEPQTSRRVSSAPKPSLLDVGLFRAPLTTSAMVDTAESIRVADATRIMEQVRAVSAMKKKEEAQLYKKQRMLTVRRKNIPLFQYRVYKDQVPLTLSDDQMEILVSALVQPPSDNDRETCLMASKILIKVLIDMYIKGEAKRASELLLTLTENMFDADSVETKMHAFNFLFNLAIHANLVEETVFGSSSSYSSTTPESPNFQPSSSAPLPSSPPPSPLPLSLSSTLPSTALLPPAPAIPASAHRAMSASSPELHYSLVASIHSSLFEVLKQTFFIIYHKVDERRVWNAAFNCLLFFVTAYGEINLDRLLTVDVKIIISFLRHIDDTESRATLIRALTNIMYRRIETHDPMLSPRARSTFSASQIALSDSPNADVLQQCGGIDSVLYFFTRERTREAIDNLFTVIFDYVACRAIAESGNKAPHHHHKSAKSSSDEDIQALLYLFHMLNVPLLLVDLCKVPPRDTFAESMVRFVEKRAQQCNLGHILQERGESARRLLIAFATGFDRLVSEYCQLDPDIEAKAKAISQSSKIDLIPELHASLFSKDLFSRRNGELWLYTTLIGLEDEEKTGEKAGPRSSLEKLLDEMIRSKRPEVRLSYVSVIERLVLFQRSRVPVEGNSVSSSGGVGPPGSADDAGANGVGAMGGVDGVSTQCGERITNLLNSRIGALVKNNELNENVLLHALDVLTRHLFHPLTASRTPKLTVLTPDGNVQDTIYSQFLAGHAVVSRRLVAAIDGALLGYIFANLPPRFRERVALLVLINNKAKDNPSSLDSMGGTQFYRSLLTNRDPEIAFYASQALIDQIKTDDPAQFQNIFDRLMTKAQRTNDVELLANPYLMIRALIDGV